MNAVQTLSPTDRSAPRRAVLRRVAPDENDARDQLLSTAGQLLCENDRLDLSFVELAAASGRNSALVKYYFGNKVGLLAALVERDFVEVLAALAVLMRKDADPETRLRLHLATVADTFFRKPYIHGLLMRLIREGEPRESRRLADAFLKPLLAAYDRMIGEGVRAGVFRPVDPRFFYFTVVGAADRFFTARHALQLCASGSVLDEDLRRRYRIHLNDFVLAGILR